MIVIPNQLRERLVIPDQRKGVISVSDITTDDAQAGTTGYIIVGFKMIKLLLSFSFLRSMLKLFLLITRMLEVFSPNLP